MAPTLLGQAQLYPSAEYLLLESKAIAREDYVLPPDEIFIGGPSVEVDVTRGSPSSRHFGGTSGRKVSLRINNIVGITASLTVRLKEPGGAIIATSTVYTTGGFIDATLLGTAGTYSIELVLGVGGAATGKATLTLYDASDLLGSIIPDGSLSVASAQAPGQKAVQSFPAAAGLVVSLVASKTTASAVVALRSASGTSLGTVTVSPIGATQFIDAVPLTTPGTGTVEFDPSGTNTGIVNLQLYTVQHSSQAITANGAAVQVATQVPGQNADLLFEGATGQSITLRLTQVTLFGMLGAEVSIYKPDGSVLTGPTSLNTTSKTIGPITLPASGTYRIFLDPKSYNTGSTTFELDASS